MKIALRNLEFEISGVELQWNKSKENKFLVCFKSRGSWNWWFKKSGFHCQYYREHCDTFATWHYVSKYKLCMTYIYFWMDNTRKTSTCHQRMVCGKFSQAEESKNLEIQVEGRLKKSCHLTREHMDFLWKNPRRILRCTEFSVIESFTKIILSFFKLEAELCVIA